ncbi:MAG TPA: UvrB/UvrC motif-containing protein [Candidatus Paceibacterota bacterium]|nr:UvrB/UvrC motif-containing protein [Candidatus Paceibacterota bacterium]
MDLDISHLLEHWDYKPGQVVVRKFKSRDGSEKIQLRVDLGLLQMNAEGRPDGKQPFGYPSLYEYYQSKLYKHLAENNGNEEGFRLNAEDCSKLQLESLQYHHRYICLLQLGDYAGVTRDTERNLTVFNFVGKHAESEELAWSVRQFQPQLLMIHTRAQATESLEAGDYIMAMGQVEEGMESIRNFLREQSRADVIEQCGEIQSLEAWLNEIRTNRPLSEREKLENALSEAVKSEDYEKAAQVRDALKNLQAKEK